jgi:murein DD-endopeptidase MepM/ murein hydrolase activator NlpD
MKRKKFIYNPETCRYEPFYLRGRLLRHRIMTFLLLSMTIALAGYFWLNRYFETIDELLLEQKNQTLKVEWDILHNHVGKAQQELAEFIDKDDNNYRVILDSDPLPASIREAGIGGSERINYKIVKEFPVILNEYTSIEKLKHQLDVEIQSYKELDRLLDQKISMWASRPAIQPINNAQLHHLHLTFGLRMHPIFHVMQEHKGLDFTAAQGTPVYATGDGKISQAYFSASYGNVIFLDHGFDYETRYAHLHAFEARPGERVKRGQIIGYVGNTGNSVSDHLHYEVLFRGAHVNPINFFQRDLNNNEYEKLIEEAGKHLNSLD